MRWGLVAGTYLHHVRYWPVASVALCLLLSLAVVAQSYDFGSLVAKSDVDVGESLALAPAATNICGGHKDALARVVVFNSVPSVQRAISGTSAGGSMNTTDSCYGWPGISYLDESADANYNPGEPLLLDLDGSGSVSAGDVRISEGAGLVSSTDSNLGWPLSPAPVSFYYAPESDGAEFSDTAPWYISSSNTVSQGDTRLGGAYPEPASTPPTPTPTATPTPTPPPATSPTSPSGPAGVPPADLVGRPPPDSDFGRAFISAPEGPIGTTEAYISFSAALVLALLAPVLASIHPRAELAAALSSWILHGLLLAFGSVVALLSLGILVWNGVAFLAYRINRANGIQSASGLAGTVGLVSLLEVHADIENHTWNRDFWLRATSDDGPEPGRVSFVAEAQLGSYQLFFYRRHRVRLAPRIRLHPGDPPRVEQTGSMIGASGSLAVALQQQVEPGTGAIHVHVAAEVAFATRAWKVAFAAKGLNVDGEVGGDNLQHRVGLGVYPCVWESPTAVEGTLASHAPSGHSSE